MTQHSETTIPVPTDTSTCLELVRELDRAAAFAQYEWARVGTAAAHSGYMDTAMADLARQCAAAREAFGIVPGQA